MPSIRENVKLHSGFSGPLFCHFIYERRPFSCRKKSFYNCKPQNVSVDMDVLTNFFDDCKLAESGWLGVYVGQKAEDSTFCVLDA